MKYKAVGSKVILKALPPPPDDESGGIIVPEKVATAIRAKQTPIIELEILAVGPDCKVARAGDKAVANVNSVHSIPLPDGQSVAILPEGELIAVLPA